MGTQEVIEAVLRETFVELREKSVGFTKPCTIALNGAAAFVLCLKPYKELLGLRIKEELLKHYVAAGDRAIELLEGERPQLTTERGNPPTLTFEIKAAKLIAAGAPAAKPRSRPQRTVKAKSRR